MKAIIAIFVLNVSTNLVTVECGDVSEHFLTPTFSKEVLTGSIDCVNGVLSLVPRFVDVVKPCLPGLSEVYGTKPGQKHPNCSWFCQAKACNFLAEDNIPNHDLYMAFIDLAVREDFKEKVKAHVKTCVEKLGAAVKLSDDCAEAAVFNNCIFEIFAWPCS